MSTKTMLYALSRVNQWLLTPGGVASDMPDDLRTQVVDAVVAGSDMLTKMGRKPRADGQTDTVGRPPSTAYIVEFSNYEPFTVLGGQAAAEAVNLQMAALGEKRRFTAGNISVQVSRNGGWFHNVETSNGTVTLAVRREPPAKKSAQ